MSTSPLAGRVRSLVLLAILLLATPATAQAPATATVTLSLQEPDVANGTGVALANVRLDVSGHLCTNPPTFTVQLRASNDAGLPIQVRPDVLDIPVGQDDALRGTTHTTTATITVGPAPPGSRADVVLDALPPAGGCGTVERVGDSANTTMEWVAQTPDGPERLMPGPGLPLLLVGLAAARRGGPKKPMAISSP